MLFLLQLQAASTDKRSDFMQYTRCVTLNSLPENLV